MQAHVFIRIFIQKLNHFRYKHYAFESNGQPFFRKILKDESGHNSILFANDSIVGMVNQMDEINLSADGTFKCVPRFTENGFLQLFNIYG